MVKKIIKLEEGRIIISEQQKKEEDKKKSSPKYSIFNVVNIAMEMGFSIALPMAGGALLGAYLDKKFNTLPKLTLSLLFLGLIIGIYNSYQMLSSELERS